MDDQRFDNLARFFADMHPRRRVLKLLAGSVVAAVSTPRPGKEAGAALPAGCDATVVKIPTPGSCEEFRAQVGTTLAKAVFKIVPEAVYTVPDASDPNKRVCLTPVGKITVTFSGSVTLNLYDWTGTKSGQCAADYVKWVEAVEKAECEHVADAKQLIAQANASWKPKPNASYRACGDTWEMADKAVQAKIIEDTRTGKFGTKWIGDQFDLRDKHGHAAPSMSCDNCEEDNLCDGPDGLVFGKVGIHSTPCGDACCGPCAECGDPETSTCVPIEGCCDPSCTGCQICEGNQCVPGDCGDPCQRCIDGICQPISCARCEVCDGGTCRPRDCGDCQECRNDQCLPVDCGDPCLECVVDSCITKTCGSCEFCEAGSCVPVECAACEVCQDDACVPRDCGECQECADDQCVPVDCGDPCLECVENACQPIVCGVCEACSDGVCNPDPTCCDPACGDCEDCRDGECVATDCGDPCLECVGDSCQPIRCPPCETCADGVCNPDPTCCDPPCADCEECSDGVCNPVDCGPCSDCDANSCRPRECGDCNECVDDQCVPVDCGDACLECVENSCQPKACDACEPCVDGVCTPIECDACQVCVDGACVPCQAGTTCCGGTCIANCPAGSVLNRATCQCEFGNCAGGSNVCSNAPRTCGTNNSCICRNGVSASGNVCTSAGFLSCIHDVNRPCTPGSCPTGYACISMPKSCCASGTACAGLCAS